jgi:hypothetical protein
VVNEANLQRGAHSAASTWAVRQFLSENLQSASSRKQLVRPLAGLRATVICDKRSEPAARRTFKGQHTVRQFLSENLQSASSQKAAVRSAARESSCGRDP